MSFVQNLLPVPAPQSDAPTQPLPQSSLPGLTDTGIATAEPPKVSPDQGWWDSFAQAPSSEKTNLEPVTFDWDKTNAGAYVGTKNFKQLGFDPALGDVNELKYHNAQTALDVAGDTIGKFASNVAHGFTDMASGWSNTAALLTGGGFGEAFKQNELEEAQKREQDRENSYHIYRDPTDKSAISWDGIAKGIQDAGGIVGAGAEIVAEQLLVMSTIAATFGTTALDEGAIIPQEALRLGEVVGQTSKIVNTLDKAASIRSAYNAFKESSTFSNVLDVAKQGAKYSAGYGADVLEGLGKGWVPGANSLGAIATGNLSEALKAKNAAAILGSVGRGFGAFYNDIRDINLAVSMGQGGAGSVYQQQIDEQSKQYKNDNGVDPVGLDLEHIKDNAYKAAKTDGAYNALVAFYTNKLAFGNLLKGNKAVQDALLANTPGEFSNLVRGTTEKEFAETGDRLAMKPDKWDTFRNRAIRKLTGLKNPDTYLSMGLHGIGFGTVMSSQATIDDAVKAYYSAKYDHKDITAAYALSEGIGKQFTKEGAKTFISGLLTGAVISPLIETGSELISRRAQKGNIGTEPILPENPTTEQTEFYNKAKAEYDDKQLKTKSAAQDYVDKVNEQWKNPVSGLGDLILQSQWNEKINGGLVANNKKSVEDNRSDSAIDFLVSAARNGMMKPYIDHLQDKINQLSPEELHDAIYANVPAGQKPQFTEEVHGETMQKVSDFIDKAKDIGKVYKDLLRQFPYPINPSNYKLGTPEREAAQKLYDQHSRYLGFLAYYKASVIDKVNRQNKILYGDNISGGLQEHLHDIPFYNVSTFASIPRINEELGLLKTLAESESLPGNVKAARYTNTQVENLTKYKELIEEYIKEYNRILSKDIDEDTRKQELNDHDEEYGKAMSPILRKLIDNKLMEIGRKPIDNESLEKVTRGYLDYHQLSTEHDNMLDTINKVIDPNGKHDYFKSFIKAEKDAMTWEAYKAASEPIRPDKVKEATNKKTPDAPIGETIPFEESTEPFTTTKPETVPQKADEEDIHKQLIAHLSPSGEEDVDEERKYSPEVSRYMESEKGKDLQAKLDALAAVSTDVDEFKKAARAIVDDHFDHVQELNSHPELKGEPHTVEVKKGDYRVMSNGKAGTDVYKTPGDANRALQVYIDKNHPVLNIEGRNVRIGQRLYDSEGKEWVVDKMKGEYVKLVSWPQTREVKTLDGYYDSKAEIAEDVPRETPKYRKPTKWNDHVQIYPHRLDGENSKQAQERVSEVLRNTPQGDFQDSLSLSISKGPKSGEVIKSDNPFVKQNRERWTLQLNLKGQPFSYITSPGMYSWYDEKGNPVPIQNLDIKLFEKGFDTEGKDGVELLRIYKENDLQTRALEDAITSHMKGKDISTLSGKQLSDFIDIIPMTGGYDFYNNPDPNAEDSRMNRPLVSELEKKGNKLLSVTDERAGRVVYGDKDAHLDMKTPWTGLSNYRGVLQMPNGTKHWVELQGKRYTETESDHLLSQVSTMFKDWVKSEGDSFKSLKKAINKVLDKIFIALDPKDRLSIKPQVATSKKSPVFQLAFTFRDGAPDINTLADGLINVNKLLFIQDEEGKTAKFIEAIHHELNEYFKKKGSDYRVDIPYDALRESFPSKFDEGTAMGLQSSVGPGILKRPYLTYKVKNTTIPEEYIPGEESMEPSEQSLMELGELAKNVDYSGIPDEDILDTIMNEVAKNIPTASNRTVGGEVPSDMAKLNVGQTKNKFNTNNEPEC